MKPRSLFLPSPFLAAIAAVATFCGPLAMAEDDGPGVSRVIPVEETRKLEAIRDEIGEIRDLETLYEDRRHKNGLPYHVYVPEGLKAGVNYPMREMDATETWAPTGGAGSTVTATPYPRA